MDYDKLFKQAQNFDFLSSPKVITGNPQLGRGLLYLAQKFSLPDIISMVGDSFSQGEPVNRDIVAKAQRALEAVYYQDDFRKLYSDSIIEFSTIKDNLSKLID